MEDIKEELKKVITEVMLPESKEYLEELNKAIKNNKACKDDLNAKEDIEFFIEELNSIIKVINEDKISKEDAKSVYEKIITMLEEHED